MIKERVETEDFALEITLEFKGSETPDAVYYEKSIESIVNLIAGAIYSGELFSFFMKELAKVNENLISAMQTEQALGGTN